ELPLRILTFALSTKSPYDLAVARNSFFLSFPSVRPTIWRSSTVNSDLSSGVTQPERSLPLNSGRNRWDSWPDAQGEPYGRPRLRAPRSDSEARARRGE